MAEYTRKEFELTRGVQVPPEERLLAAVGDTLTGDAYDENCSCVYVAKESGRPVRIEKINCCQNCAVKDVILTASVGKIKRMQEIKFRLEEIDKLEGVRASRERDLNRGDIGIVDSVKWPEGRLRMLEDEATTLRTELRGLENA